MSDHSLRAALEGIVAAVEEMPARYSSTELLLAFSRARGVLRASRENSVRVTSHDMSDFQRRVNAWREPRYPDSTVPATLRHLGEEVGEFHEALFAMEGSAAAVAEEAADVVILLAGLGHLVGFDLGQAVEAKLRHLEAGGHDEKIARRRAGESEVP